MSLPATLHRTGKDSTGSGPGIAVLAYHAFQSITGIETLTDPDRLRMMSGGLYLHIAVRSKVDNLRLTLKPPAETDSRRAPNHNLNKLFGFSPQRR